MGRCSNEECLLCTRREVMQISSDESADDLVYFVAIAAYLGDKRSAYGQHIRFALSTFNSSAPADDVITSSPGDDVIIRGLHVDFSLVASLPYSPSSNATHYTVTLLRICTRHAP